MSDDEFREILGGMGDDSLAEFFNNKNAAMGLDSLDGMSEVLQAKMRMLKYAEDSAKAKEILVANVCKLAGLTAVVLAIAVPVAVVFGVVALFKAVFV